MTSRSLTIIQHIACMILLLFATYNVALAAGRSDTLIVLVESGPNTMDIHGVGANRPSYQIAVNLYDRLIGYGKKILQDGTESYDYSKLEPELAESWELSPDGMSVVFHLRRDATFWDGTPVTAQDVKWSFDRAVSVGGFPTVQMAAGSLEKPEQFVAVDDHTFRIDFLRKDKLTLPDLGVPVPIVINSKLAKKYATAADPWALEYLKRTPAGGGAFKLERWDPGQQVVFQRFDGWKSGTLPQVARVIVREVPSAANRRALFERGDADVSLDMPPKDFQELAQNPKFKVAGVPIENGIWYLGMGVKSKPFDDVRVRKAVAYALPYEALFKAAAYGRAVPLWGDKNGIEAVWPQQHPFYTDISKAKALMVEAGYANGVDVTLYLDLGSATVGEPAALMIQESLAQIGIRTQIEKVPGSNWRAKMLEKSMPLYLNFFSGWLNYPEYFFFWAYDGANRVFNTMSYQNPNLDQLIEHARFESDPKKYESVVRAMIEVAWTDMPRVPLWQPYLDVALQPNVHGYRYWFHRMLDLRSLYKD